MLIFVRKETDSEWRAGEHQSLHDVPPVRLKFNQLKGKLAPVVSRLMPLIKKELESVRAWINEALEKGVIEPWSWVCRTSVLPIKQPKKILEAGSRKPQHRIRFQVLRQSVVLWQEVATPGYSTLGRVPLISIESGKYTIYGVWRPWHYTLSI